jgi:hypothetical protein
MNFCEDGPGWRRRAHNTVQPCSLPTVQTNWLHNSSGCQSKASLNPLKPGHRSCFRVFVVSLRSAASTCCSHAICRQARHLTHGVCDLSEDEKDCSRAWKRILQSNRHTQTDPPILDGPHVCPLGSDSDQGPTTHPLSPIALPRYLLRYLSTKYHCRPYAPATQRG